MVQSLGYHLDDHRDLWLAYSTLLCICPQLLVTSNYGPSVKARPTLWLIPLNTESSDHNCNVTCYKTHCNCKKPTSLLNPQVAGCNRQHKLMTTVITTFIPAKHVVTSTTSATYWSGRKFSRISRGGT